MVDIDSVGEWLEDVGNFSRYAIDSGESDGESIWIYNECGYGSHDCRPYEDYCPICYDIDGSE